MSIYRARLRNTSSALTRRMSSQQKNKTGRRCCDVANIISTVLQHLHCITDLHTRIVCVREGNKNIIAWRCQTAVTLSNSLPMYLCISYLSIHVRVRNILPPLDGKRLGRFQWNLAGRTML